MTLSKSILAAYKLSFGLLGLSAIVTEIVVLVGRDHFNPVNFFSYFTVESNILAGIVLLLSAVSTIRAKQSKGFAMLRGASVLYMLVVGVGFAVLLSGVDAEFTAVPWDNLVLHYILPFAVFVDWLIDPPKGTIRFRRALPWLVVPVVYVGYSLVRGQLTGWYPYPFLNPATDGWCAVILTITGLVVLTLALTWALTKLTDKKLHFRR